MPKRFIARAVSRVVSPSEPAIGVLLLLTFVLAVAGAGAVHTAASLSVNATRSEASAAPYDELHLSLTMVELARHEVLNGEAHQAGVIVSNAALLGAAVDGLPAAGAGVHSEKLAALAAEVSAYQRAVSRTEVLAGQVDPEGDARLDRQASTLMRAVAREQQLHRADAVRQRARAAEMMSWLQWGVVTLFVVVVSLAVVATRRIARRRRELLAANAEAEHISLHDSLTGLPNRRALLRRVEDALSHRDDTAGASALLWLDLDGFKEINDSRGHQSGDEILTAVGRRLRTAVRGSDLVARLGGDEFVVFCRQLPSAECAVELAERVLHIVAQPIDVGAGGHVVTASIGVAMTPAADAGSLFAAADAAMYEAKRLGRGRVAVFDESLRTALSERLTLTEQLRAATPRGELRLHYQPIVELRTDEVVGVEALVRWQHPTRGLLAPGSFIEIAEQTGLVSEIGAWVIEQACRTLARWQHDMPGRRPLQISVNLAARQVSDPAIVRTVKDAVTATGADPAMLKLEVTESSVMADLPRAIATLEELRSLGTKIAIDDFGTGYSSLTYLKQFPAHEIKLDKSFVDGVGTGADDSAIVAAVVNLARAVGLRVVAEGVETARQLAVLRTLGCDYGQGYLWLKPMPVAAVEQWLAGRRHATSAHTQVEPRPR